MPTARTLGPVFALLFAAVLGVVGCSPFARPRDTAKETRKVEFLVFSAKWCSVCRDVPPVLSKLRANHPDVTFVELDVDEGEGQKLAAEYRVDATPYNFIRIDGKVVARQRGLLPYPEAEKFLRGAMKK